MATANAGRPPIINTNTVANVPNLINALAIRPRLIRTTRGRTRTTAHFGIYSLRYFQGCIFSVWVFRSIRRSVRGVYLCKTVSLSRSDTPEKISSFATGFSTFLRVSFLFNPTMLKSLNSSPANTFLLIADTKTLVARAHKANTERPIQTTGPHEATMEAGRRLGRTAAMRLKSAKKVIGIQMC